MSTSYLLQKPTKMVGIVSGLRLYELENVGLARLMGRPASRSKVR